MLLQIHQRIRAPPTVIQNRVMREMALVTDVLMDTALTRTKHASYVLFLTATHASRTIENANQMAVCRDTPSIPTTKSASLVLTQRAANIARIITPMLVNLYVFAVVVYI